MANDFLEKAMLTLVSLGAIILALKTFDFDVIGSIVPQYASLIYRVIGGIGAYLLYTLYRR